MDLLSSLIKDLVVIGVIASFCDLLLPQSKKHHSVQLVFGLYFMALMLNPLVALFQDTDLSAVDFETLAEEKIADTEFEYSEEMVYNEAAKTLSREIEGKLEALYDRQVSVSVEMSVDGFQKVDVNIAGSGPSDAVSAAEIKDYLASEYGIATNLVYITVGKG